jgi:ADP-ribose pyrophosphatase YjhB (NUDIX family)
MPRLPPQYCPYCGTELDSGSPARCQCGEFVVQQPVTAVETLVVEDGSVLLQKRDAGRNRGTWGFPGGHVEFGEPPWVAAARELREETGLEVAPREFSLFDATYSENEDGSHYLVVGFAVDRSGTNGEIDGGDEETAVLSFVAPGELPAESELFEPEYAGRIERVVEWSETGDSSSRFLDLR